MQELALTILWKRSELLNIALCPLTEVVIEPVWGGKRRTYRIGYQGGDSAVDELRSIHKASLCTSCWQFEWQKRPKTFLLIKRNAMKKKITWKSKERNIPSKLMQLKTIMSPNEGPEWSNNYKLAPSPFRCEDYSSRQLEMLNLNLDTWFSQMV